MALDTVLSVAVLPAGASAVMAHGISDIYGALHDTLGSRQEYIK